MVLGVVGVAAPAPSAPTPPETALIQAVNAVRAQHGLPSLSPDARLERAARAQSGAVLRSGRLSHGNVRARMTRFGVHGRAVGENLAWGVGSRGSAGGIVQMWLASPPHRANLLRRGFRKIGVGHEVGTFGGYGGATVVAATFSGR